MQTRSNAEDVTSRPAISGILLLVVAIGGILVLLFFWNQLLQPNNLGALSLPLLAIVGGAAATFNPCAVPALPAFLALVGGNREMSARGRAKLSLAAGIGALATIVILGLFVAFLGTEVKDLVAPHFRWVQLGIGLFLIVLAALHLAGQTMRLPLVSPLMAAGNRIWEKVVGRPTAGGSFLFGAGFVAVGAG